MKGTAATHRDQGEFETTHQSLLGRLARGEGEAREALVRAYWKPVYKYLRVRWRRSHDEAADLTQGFFLDCFERRVLATFVPGRARFRTYLRACLDHYAGGWARAARALKRGGRAIHVDLDFEGAAAELARAAAPGGDFERYFEVEWARHMVSGALAALRDELEGQGKGAYFAVFCAYDLPPEAGEAPSYAEVAARLGLKVTDVTNYLSATRRAFRRHVLERVREATADDDEFRAEAAALLGRDR